MNQTTKSFKYCFVSLKYSGALVQELNLFQDFAKEGHVSVCVGRMAMVVFVTQCSFSDKNKILRNDSFCEPNCL